MADISKTEDCKVVNNAPQVTLKLSTSSEDGNTVFRYKLPKDGLALRSVTIVDGLPELHFDAFPNVPTIQEEDIATLFRLVSENKRPEFGYIRFPSTHPMHQCRYFKIWFPEWLRWTALGEDLAEADWKMKCLSIGTKSNEDKSAFKSWSAESQLENLATILDFPLERPDGCLIMSCESAKVLKSDDEIMFPEEPKMKITNDLRPLYSKYITEIYQSVAYYDEPNFLKMQELIKLILAVEWLYKEKGVRVNHEWMMMHTSGKKNDEAYPKNSTRKKPPYHMIPKLTTVKRPRSDVTVKTREAEINKTLTTKCQAELQYGYIDFAGAQVIQFKQDGTLCPPQKCLKLCIERYLTLGQWQWPGSKLKEWYYHPILEQVETTTDEPLKLMPKDSHQEIALVPVTVDKQIKVTSSVHQVSLTTVTTATMDNSHRHFTEESPNMLIRPGLFPDVKSWDELISDLTVPIPYIFWQAGNGVPMDVGGVKTSSFPVREKPLPKQEFREETRQWNGNYSRNGSTLTVRAEQVRVQGKIRLVDRQSQEFADVSRKFSESWIKGSPPPVDFIFAVTNPYLDCKWKDYRQSLSRQKFEEHYHGTTLACNITRSQTLCDKEACGICGISCSGLDPKCIGKNIDFQRFGRGFYLAPNSSKCHDYTKGAHGYRAMLQCDVLPGKKYTITTNDQKRTGTPPGYDSVYGQVGTKLNYPEIVVYNPHSAVPRYIIVYKKDEVGLIAN